jgi:hypothetical protein
MFKTRRERRRLEKQLKEAQRFRKALDAPGPLKSMPTRDNMEKDRYDTMIREIQERLAAL